MSKPKVIQYAAPIVPDFNNDDFITSSIKLCKEEIPGTDAAGEKYDDTKFTVAIKRYKYTVGGNQDDLDAEISEHFGEGFGLQWALDTFLNPGVMTKPGYQAAAADACEAGNYEEAHRLAQKALDDWVPGRKNVGGGTQKAKIQKANQLDAIAAKLGLTADEVLARIASGQPLS